MGKLNVLITSAGSAPAVSVMKALKAQSEIAVKIIAIDMDPLSSGFFLSEKRYEVPDTNDPGFSPYLLDICRKENIKFIFAIIDEELPVFAGLKDEFQKEGICIIVNDAEVVRVGNDKSRTFQFCLDNGIKIPELVPLPLEREKILYPLIIRPLDGRGSVDVFKINDSKELHFFKDYVKNAIIQEFIDGDEYTIDIVASPKGEILQAVPRRRLVTKAGMSYKGKTVKDERLIQYGKTVAKKFRVNGPCNVQCILKGDEIYFIELNPKFAAGLPLTVAAGVNIPLLLLKMAMGRKINNEELEFKDNFYMLRYWEEIFTEKINQ